MKKTLLAAAVLSALCVSLATAFDFGFELSNKVGFEKTTGTDWYTDHKETLWLTVPFDADNANSLAIEGSAYASKPAQSANFRLYANLDLFRVTLVPVSLPNFKLSLDLGRIATADITGFVLSQKIDGIEFHGTFAFGNVDLMAGYTGLLNAREGVTLMSDDDIADYATESIYALGAKRAVGKLTLQFPQLIGTSDLVIEGIGQYDMRRYASPAYAQTVDTLYGTLSLNGPLFDSVFYQLSGTWQSGVLNESSLSYSENALLASLRVDAFPVAGNHLFAQFVYTPPRGDFFSDFLPVSFYKAGTLFEQGYGNLMKASAGWFFTPASFLNIDLGGNVFFNSKETTAGSGFYNGTELTGGATLRLTSDLRFRIDSAFLFSLSQAMQYQAAVKAILEL
jgi:hypothetical protein